MKCFLSTLVSVVAAVLLWGQEVSKPTGTLGSEDVIRRMIGSGIYEGHDAKTLGGMGDAAAVLVTKVVADRHLSAEEIDSVLSILNGSFAGGANATSDREPRTALFVLQYLDTLTKDLKLKGRIADTRKYIVEQYEKHKKD